MSFSISRAFSQAFEFASAKFGAMLAVSLIAMVLSWLLMATYFGSMMGTIMSDPSAGEAMMSGMGASPFFVSAANFAISLTGYAAICALCSDREEHTVGTALGAGVRAMPSLFAAWVLLVIGMLVVAGVMILALGGIFYAGESPLMAFVAVIGIAAAMAYLLTKFSLVLPVAVIDEVRNPFLLIGRSWTLTSGATLKIFVIYLVIIVVLAVVGLTTFMTLIGMPNLGQVPAMGSLGVMVVGYVVIGIAFQIYFTALSAAIHRQLAGTSSEAMAGAFA